jgi:hypothetical protein
MSAEGLQESEIAGLPEGEEHEPWVGRRMAPLSPEPWVIRIGRNRWQTFRVIRVWCEGHGWVEVPKGYVFDLFTGVPNTRHERLWLAALVHDYLCETKLVPRELADAFFARAMVEGAFATWIGTRGADQGREALRELRRMLRLAATYYLGVSGVAGSVFHWQKSARAFLARRL